MYNLCLKWNQANALEVNAPQSLNTLCHPWRQSKFVEALLGHNPTTTYEEWKFPSVMRDKLRSSLCCSGSALDFESCDLVGEYFKMLWHAAVFDTCSWLQDLLGRRASKHLPIIGQLSRHYNLYDSPQTPFSALMQPYSPISLNFEITLTLTFLQVDTNVSSYVW